MNKSYILQEQTSRFEYLDLYESQYLSVIKKALKAMKEKNPNKKYRIVLWRLYV